MKYLLISNSEVLPHRVQPHLEVNVLDFFSVVVDYAFRLTFKWTYTELLQEVK